MSEYDDLLPDAETQSKPEAVEPPEEELPPEPGEEGDLTFAPLAVRESHKLAQMTPERRAAYEKATGQIMAHPAVAAFAEGEKMRDQRMEVYRKAFLAEYKKTGKLK